MTYRQDTPPPGRPSREIAIRRRYPGLSAFERYGPVVRVPEPSDPNVMNDADAVFDGPVPIRAFEYRLHPGPPCGMWRVTCEGLVVAVGIA